MNRPDVNPGEMNDDALTDAEIESLFEHKNPGAINEPLARFVVDARAIVANIEPAKPSPALLEFIDVSAPTIPIRITTPEVEVVELIEIDRSVVSYRSTKRRVVSAAAMFALVGGVFVSAVASGPGFRAGDESVVAVGSSTSPAIADAARDTGQDSANSDKLSSTADASGTSGQSVSESSSTQQGQGSSATSGSEPTGLTPTSASIGSTSDTQVSATTSPTTSSSTTSTSSSSTSVPSTVANQSFSYSVSGIGSVTVSVIDGYVAFSGASPQSGWTVEDQHTDGIEAEIRFTDGEVRVRLRAEVEDGLLRVRVQDERNDDDRDDSDSDSDDSDSDDSDSDDSDSDDSDSDDSDSDDSD